MEKSSVMHPLTITHTPDPNKVLCSTANLVKWYA